MHNQNILKKTQHKNRTFQLAIVAVVFAAIFAALFFNTYADSAYYVTSIQEAIIREASTRDPYDFVGGQCIRWVRQVYSLVGYETTSGNANEYARAYYQYSDKDGDDINSTIEPGMFIASEHSGTSDLGNQCGHIGIYIGNDTVLHLGGDSSAGQVISDSLDDWIEKYYEDITCNDYYGTSREGNLYWGYPDDILADIEEERAATLISLESGTVSLANGVYTVVVDSTTLTQDTDFTVTVSNGEVTIEGIGDYTGTITKKILTSSTAYMTLSKSKYTYGGSAYTPTATVNYRATTSGLYSKLTKDEDYTVSYTDNTLPGLATVTVTGTGEYIGTLTKTFTITATFTSGYASVSLSESSYTYDGTAKKPEITAVYTYGNSYIPMLEGTDFIVTYTNNVSVGTATVTIKGYGYYSGTITKTFTITERSLDEATVVLPAPAYAYTGSAITPAPTVAIDGDALTAGTDYTVSYSNNKNTGTATVTITGCGNYSGTITTTFVISRADCISEIDGTLYYVNEYGYTTSYTGVAANDDGVWYISGGIVNTSYTKLYNDVYYFQNGQFASSYTGLYEPRTYHTTWYIENGIIDYTVTKVYSNEDTGYYYQVVNNYATYCAYLSGTLAISSVSATSTRITVKATTGTTSGTYDLDGFVIRYRVAGTDTWTTKTVSTVVWKSKTYTATATAKLTSGTTYEFQLQWYQIVNETADYAGDKVYSKWSSTYEYTK